MFLRLRLSHAVVLVLLGCPDNCVVPQITPNAIVLQIFGQVFAATELEPLFHQSHSGEVELIQLPLSLTTSPAVHPGGHIFLSFYGLRQLSYRSAICGVGEKPRGALVQLAERRELLGSDD